MLDQAKDFDSTLTGICYRSREELPGYLQENVPDVLRQLTDFLGDRNYFTGSILSAADLLMCVGCHDAPPIANLRTGSVVCAPTCPHAPSKSIPQCEVPNAHRTRAPRSCL